MEKQISYAPRYSVTPEGVVYGTRGPLKARHVGYVGNGSSYRQVALYEGNKRFDRYVRVLVAEAFLPGKFEGVQVNHKDGDKCNSRLDNLEWVSASDNMRHATRGGLVKPYLVLTRRGIRHKRLTEVQSERSTTISVGE